MFRCVAIDYSPGCFTNALFRNDDSSSGIVPIGFTIDLFGASYSSLYVNNNGNVTFDFPYGSFTPAPLISNGVRLIAPFWADVDTRNAASGQVHWGNTMFQGRPAFCVTWADVSTRGVGYYNGRADKLNNFQLLIVDRSDVSPKNFNIVFNYDKVQWETGEASGGVNGLGGASARAGYANPPGTTFELPGSGVNGKLLDSSPTGLIHGSLNSSILGQYVLGPPTTTEEAVPPPFTYVQPLPDPAACICTPRIMNIPGEHNWYVMANGASLDVNAVTLSVNPAEQGNMQFEIIAPDGVSVLDSWVQAMPTGGPLEISAVHSVPTTAGEIYQVRVTLMPPPSPTPTAHHYRFEFHGATQAGMNMPTPEHFEPAPEGVVWYVAANGTERPQLRVAGETSVSPVNLGAPTWTIVLRDPNDVVADTQTGTGAVPTWDGSNWTSDGFDVTVTAPYAMAGLWSLSIETNRHHEVERLDSVPVDSGLYLTWQSYGEGTATVSVTAPSTPVTVVLTNTVTGQTFTRIGMGTFTLPFIPSGHYTVSVSSASGLAELLTPAEIDVWCGASLEISVNLPNRPPVISIVGRANPADPFAPAPFVIDETRLFQLQVNASDPDHDPLTYSWTLLDGDGTLATGLGGTTGPSISYRDNDGPSIALVQVEVTDGPGGHRIVDTALIDVRNVSPTVFLPSPPAGLFALEGSSFTSCGSFHDPAGALDAPYGVFIDYGDGTTTSLTGTLPSTCGSGLGTGSFPLVHTYAENGIYTISVTVTDKDNGTATRQVGVTVRNAAPAILLNPASVDEGGVATLSGAIGDPGVLDTHTVTIAWGDGSVETLAFGAGASGPFTATHQYLDDSPTSAPSDTMTVAAFVVDDDGGAGSDDTTIVVNNLAPVLGAISAPAPPQLVGALVSASAVITDPGVLDTHTCSVGWGDGATTAGTVSGGSCTASHGYAAAGVYTLTMTVVDDDTGTSTSTFSYVVVYGGPGFVTAGGWLNSPAGGYVPDPSLAGRANFGLNARNRANGTAGQTQFQFQRDTRMKFDSSSYDWLVVSGAWALYAGSGTINGEGDYGFVVSVVDGRRAGDRVHRFRIKIWDKATTEVIYDNNPTAGDDYAVATQPTNSGSIVIH